MAFSNSAQRIPPLFQEIVKNHAAHDAIRAKAEPTQADWVEMKRLYRERGDFRRQAEKVLAWNTNKGEPA
jgi:hypothetical protein